ncbi:MAG TPA: patatin-like phospholipase family protein [Candidatus Limnocylindria bacterium]|nr:patatin-like phospholipase family protein [Candidatus Limnocylindria bacterium]
MKVEATVVRSQSDGGESEREQLISNTSPRIPRIGLALSSGGAKGLAHIGILQVLEENGIPIHAIAGSSMGAYVGAVWAYGHDGASMERFAREVEGRWGFLHLLDPVLLPRCGFIRGEKMGGRVKCAIGNAQFSDLKHPLRVVATNLCTLERAVFTEGEVALAVQASSAIPGVCAPVRIGDDLFFDGGVVDPLPVDVAREMGVDCVIAVNVIPTPSYMRCRLELQQEQMALRHAQLNRLMKMFRRTRDSLAGVNVFDIMHRTMLGAQMRLAEHSGRHADLILRPLSFDGRWHDFHHPGKYIALGRRTAEEHLDEIKALIRRHTHEHKTAHNALAVAA